MYNPHQIRVINFYLFFVSSIILIAVLSLLLAGAYIGFFNDLTFDDIIRKLANHSSILGGAKAFYFGETGRFTNGLISQHSQLYNLNVYRYLHIILSIIWVVSLFLFLKGIFDLYRVEKKIIAALFSSSLIVLMMLANAPNLSEWWFWYATASLYMFGASMLLLTYWLILKAIELDSTFLWYLSSIFAFFATGTSEMVMFLALSTVFIIAVSVLVFYRQKGVLLPLSMVLLGSLVVVLSPGTSARLEDVSGGGILSQLSSQLLLLPSGIMKTMISAIQYWLKDIYWAVLLFAMFVAGFIFKLKINKSLSLKPLLLSLILLFFLLFSESSLVVLMDWKININDPSRTNNFAYFFFLVFISVNGFLAGSYCKQRWEYPFVITHVASGLLVGLVLISLSISWNSNNIQVMYEDIKFDKPQRQQASIRHWRELMDSAINNKQKYVSLPNLIPANSLTVSRYGPSIDPHYIMNRIWSQYLGKKKVKISRRNFDKDMLQHISTNHQPLKSSYELMSYNDQYRNYLIAQIPAKTKNKNTFCVKLNSDSFKNYFVKLRDENFAQLFFLWNNNEHCTNFVSRKVFCEPYEKEWLCRIPLPLNFSGTAQTSWSNEIREIVIRR